MESKPEQPHPFTRSPMGVQRTHKQPGDLIMTSRSIVVEPPRK